MGDFKTLSIIDQYINRWTSNPVRIVTIPLCPDLLRYDQLGEADNLRGRVVRVFFWLMRVWPI